MFGDTDAIFAAGNVQWETPEQDAKEQDANVKGREVVMEEVDEDEDLEVV